MSSSSDDEELRPSTETLLFSIRHLNIGPEMKRAVENMLLGVELDDMNVTLLTAAAVVLARCNKVIDRRFSQLCDAVISEIVSSDENISGSKLYSRNVIKKDILRYCRFILSR